MANWQAVVFLPGDGEEIALAIERLAAFGCSLPHGTHSLVQTGAMMIFVIDFAGLPRHLWRVTIAGLLWTAAGTPGCLGMVIDRDASLNADSWADALASPVSWPPEGGVDTPLVLARLPSGAMRMRMRPDAFFLHS